ncbi:DNA-binding response regulator, OmpR family, contains REC and winged-helix (wHTH) domain [Caminicella sporogenes DSM 14501]|uniref:Stage 0 sporulation protein A homolog n=1 Tax=Caminicella sporogenes DSM 14501 TaxID=1121266 RepID=A0A1M6P293_9FIRM|nr:response regulator transcription factor [Caminicella sporogenes]RKD21555.1 DNA-binding response regulator [Caminicella sporogenes]SHK02089.1 DNA-binding response regulator, OmpR family, contains REC and winged-helix (wHTH) domain [Caminicella sporogenes DSM 14501]
MKKVLVLEDKAEIRQFIVINLKRAGFNVLEAETGEEALEILKNEDIDIAVLDVMLPGIDGFEVCKKIRETDKTMGIIMLTAKTQEIDKINGLVLGADDYVVKPFSPSELVARIDALYRRVDMVKNDKKEEIICGPFRLNFAQRRLFKNDMPIEVTQTEFSIMKLFLENQDKALSRDYILDAVWGEDYFGNAKVVDVNIRRLRQKIEDNPSKPKFIETVWGYGYRWKKDEHVEGN